MKKLKIIPVLFICAVLGIGLAGCSGGGGGSAGSSPSGDSSAGNNPSSPSSQSQPLSNAPVGNLGVAIFPNDPLVDNPADTTGILQVAHLLDANGNPLATPTLSSLTFSGAGDIDGASLTTGGANGVLTDADNDMIFFSLIDGTVSTSQAPYQISKSYGTDGDSIAIMSDGDNAVVSLDSRDVLLLVSGMLSKKPQAAELIPIPDYRDGVVISYDDKVLLARGGSGLTVFAISPATPAPGPLGGTVSHTFTQTIANVTALGARQNDGGGRDGMAISPTDSSRAVIITNATGAASSSVSLVTGLPTGAIISNSISVSLHVDSVAIAPGQPGDLAIVGTDSGLLMFSGVAAGKLTQVGSLYTPSYNINGKAVKLGRITTLGVTIDGKYAVAGDITNGALLTIPISAGGFGAPAGVLPGVSIPANDEMLVH